jgi:hypothetical protein
MNSYDTLDYAEWLKGLRGACVPPPDPSGYNEYSARRKLATDETLDYTTHTERNEFVINNIALLNVDRGDRVYYDVELPRISDVAADLKSLDPRVSLSVRIGSEEYEPGNSFLLVASQFSCVRVRMSFLLSDVAEGGLERLGFDYTALVFQTRHRTKLAIGSVFAGPLLYKEGVPRPISQAYRRISQA